MITIKEDSIYKFFRDLTGIDYTPDPMRSSSCSAYHLMKDIIYIDKVKFLELFECQDTGVIFEIKSKAIDNISILTNTYVYNVHDFDSIQLKLELIDFRIDFKWYKTK